MSHARSTESTPISALMGARLDIVSRIATFEWEGLSQATPEQVTHPLPVLDDQRPVESQLSPEEIPLLRCKHTELGFGDIGAQRIAREHMHHDEDQDSDAQEGGDSE